MSNIIFVSLFFDNNAMSITSIFLNSTVLMPQS